MGRTSPPSFETWLGLGAVGLAYFFVNFATFASLGVVLFTMAGELHWSATEAGFSFSLLGLACGLSSPLPAIAMKHIGGRGSMVVGASLFIIGCSFASASHSLIVFDVAIALLGVGYTFAGNIPGVILIAQWFERGSARLVGIYLMVGALGAAAAPPTVTFVVHSVGWRGHWQVLAAMASVVGLLCLAFVRDRTMGAAAKPAQAAIRDTNPGQAWTPRQAVLTPQFMMLTAALVLTMTVVTTINGTLVAHLVRLGSPQIGAAWVLGTLSFTGTLTKGFTGHFCETRPPKRFVVLGLLCQAFGCALLSVASSGAVAFAGAIAFGAGWAFALVAGWVLLMRYFGGPTGARILAIVQLVTTVGAAGPIAAGLIADGWGTFSPIFVIYAAALSLLAVPVLLMRAPEAPRGAETSGHSEDLAVLKPA